MTAGLPWWLKRSRYASNPATQSCSGAALTPWRLTSSSQTLSSVPRRGRVPAGRRSLESPRMTPAAGEAMLHLTQLMDVLIPQGNAELIRTVVETATVPTIGNLELATARLRARERRPGYGGRISHYNAKVQRPGAGNSIERCWWTGRWPEEVPAPHRSRLSAAGVGVCEGCPVTRRILRGVDRQTSRTGYPVTTWRRSWRSRWSAA